MKIQRIWYLLAFLVVVFILVTTVFKISPNKSSKPSEMSGSSNTRKVVASGGLLPQQLRQEEPQSESSDTQSVQNITTIQTQEGLEEIIMWLEALDKPVNLQGDDVLDWATNWPATGRYYARDYLRYVSDESQVRERLQTEASANPDATFGQVNPMDPNSGAMFHALDGTLIPAHQFETRFLEILDAQRHYATSSDTSSGDTGDFSDGYDRSHNHGSSEFEHAEETEEMRDEQLITVTPNKRVTQQQSTGRKGHKPTDDEGKSEFSPEGKNDRLVPSESENAQHSETGEGSGDSVQMERADEPIGMDDRVGTEDGPEN